jgi:hypothetical protein
MGHTGATSAGTFSPGGDYFCSGGKDSTVMIWRAGLHACQTEIIPGVTKTRIETELFVTDKAKVDKIPSKQEPKKNDALPTKGKLQTRPHTAKVGSAQGAKLVVESKENI